MFQPLIFRVWAVNYREGFHFGWISWRSFQQCQEQQPEQLRRLFRHVRGPTKSMNSGTCALIRLENPYAPFMEYLLTYIWLIFIFFMVNVGKYTIHGYYGYCFGIQSDVELQHLQVDAQK